MDTIFLIDYDSTFSRVEALDILAEISLDEAIDRASMIQRIKTVTDLGMNGDLSFEASINERLNILKAHRNHLSPLITRLKGLVTESMARNASFFETYSDSIYIVSSGFRDFIVPVVVEYGIKPDHVIANSFVFDDAGFIIGLDTDNPLSGDQGKVKIMSRYDFSSKEVVVIGDGYTDYELYDAGIADRFYAYTEHVARPKVVEIADNIVTSLDEILTLENIVL